MFHIIQVRVCQEFCTPTTMSAARIAENRSLIAAIDRGVFTDFMAYAYSAAANSRNQEAGWRSSGFPAGTVTSTFDRRVAAFEALVSDSGE